MNLNTNEAIKAGLLGAIAGFVIGVLSRIPFLGCLIAPLGGLAALIAGALYVYFASSGGAAVPIVEGGVGGAVAGGITGLVRALVSGVLQVLFGAARGVGFALSRGRLGGAALEAGAGVFAVVVSVIGGLIAGAILGAIGGLIFAAIKRQSK